MKPFKSQHIFLIITNSIIEIIWVFALLNVLSSFLQIGNSYLTWISISLLTIIPLLARIVGPKKSKYPEITSSILVAIGLINLSLIILIDLNSDIYPIRIYNTLLGITILTGLWLWYRSTTIATMESPEARLSMTFRIGSAIIMLLTLTDIYSSTNLHSIPIIISFYLFGISGLLIGNKIQDKNPEGINRKWNVFSFGGLGLVLSLGMLFALIRKDWSNYTTYIIDALFSFVMGIIFAFFGAISWIAKILTDLIACKGDDCPDIQPANTATANNPQSNETVMNFALESIAEQEEAKMSILNNIVNVIQWGFIILICLIILFILYQILKNAFVYAPDGGDADKIKIGDGIHVFDDLTKLLSALIPKNIKNISRLKLKRPGLNLSNTAEAINIYHQLIDLGGKLGAIRSPSETPKEFQPRLSKSLQHKLVPTSTQYFEIALYGHSTISDNEITELKYQLSELKRQINQKKDHDY